MLCLTRSDPVSGEKHIRYIGRLLTAWHNSLSVFAGVAPSRGYCDKNYILTLLYISHQTVEASKNPEERCRFLSDYSGAVRQAPGAGEPEIGG